MMNSSSKITTTFSAMACCRWLVLVCCALFQADARLACAEINGVDYCLLCEAYSQVFCLLQSGPCYALVSARSYVRGHLHYNIIYRLDVQATTIAAPPLRRADSCATDEPLPSYCTWNLMVRVCYHRVIVSRQLIFRFKSANGCLRPKK